MSAGIHVHNHGHERVRRANSITVGIFAESKAAELRQQGIPVEIAPVDITDSGTRYRLKVSGFKTKGEANTYANKVKKTSGFADTWVGVNE